MFLQRYYKLTRHGHAINAKIACPLISRIFQQMDETIEIHRYY